MEGVEKLMAVLREVITGEGSRARVIAAGSMLDDFLGEKLRAHGRSARRTFAKKIEDLAVGGLIRPDQKAALTWLREERNKAAHEVVFIRGAILPDWKMTTSPAGEDDYLNSIVTILGDIWNNSDDVKNMWQRDSQEGAEQ